MAPLKDHKNESYFKFFYIGDSSTGKTGSLESLVAAGYKIRMLDYDAGIGTLKSYVEKRCPDKIDNIDFIPIRDKMKVGSSLVLGGKRGPMIESPKAFTDGLAFMEKWDDGSNPAEWGPDYIFVLDSLSAFGRAALAWATGLNPAVKDPRQWYGTAQKGVEDTIALLMGPDFHANVIIISHVNYKEISDNVSKGYINAVGSALGPILARYTNNLILAETVGFGKQLKRIIKTVPTGLVDLKTQVAHSVEAELPLETGLATLVELIRKAT